MDARNQNQQNGPTTPTNNNDGNRPASGNQGSAASTVHDVLEKAGDAAGQAAAKVKPIVSRLPESAQAPIAKAVHSAAEAAAALPDQAQGFIETQQQRLDATAEFVRVKPMQALGMAFAAGWLIGRIMR